MAMCWFIQAAASALQLAAPATCSLGLSVGSPRAGPYLLQLPLGVHGSPAAKARGLLTSLAVWASWPASACPSFLLCSIPRAMFHLLLSATVQIGRASCRERVGQK